MAAEDVRKLSNTIQGTAVSTHGVPSVLNPRIQYCTLVCCGLTYRACCVPRALFTGIASPLFAFQGYCDLDYLKSGIPSKRIDETVPRLCSPSCGQGYCDLDYLKSGIPSKRIDVYSFGLCSVELVTGGAAPHRQTLSLLCKSSLPALFCPLLVGFRSSPKTPLLLLSLACWLPDLICLWCILFFLIALRCYCQVENKYRRHGSDPRTPSQA